MNLKHLKDNELLSNTKELVQNERQLLTKILHHLLEVERRKLYSDLGYPSLFAYAVNELKYSEGQAGRRIQATRLLKELPQIEMKIESGELSLSNISQAQSFFREVKNTDSTQKMKAEDKLKVLASLENKSAREGQRVLIQVQPTLALPKERARVLSDTHTEVRFVISDELSGKMEELRALLGTKGAAMGLAELIECMTEICIETLKIKRFGKKRVLSEEKSSNDPMPISPSVDSPSVGAAPGATPTSEPQATEFMNECRNHDRSHGHSHRRSQVYGPDPENQMTQVEQAKKSPRYISEAVRYQIWERDSGQCCICGGRRSLNIDHIKPVALGGGSEPDNLRLLCFHCNQRQAIKVFGVDHMSSTRV